MTRPARSRPPDPAGISDAPLPAAVHAGNGSASQPAPPPRSLPIPLTSAGPASGRAPPATEVGPETEPEMERS